MLPGGGPAGIQGAAKWICKGLIPLLGTGLLLEAHPRFWYKLLNTIGTPGLDGKGATDLVWREQQMYEQPILARGSAFLFGTLLTLGDARAHWSRFIPFLTPGALLAAVESGDKG